MVQQFGTRGRLSPRVNCGVLLDSKYCVSVSANLGTIFGSSPTIDERSRLAQHATAHPHW